MHFIGLHYAINISIFCETGVPEDDRSWLKRVALLIWLINIDINKVVLTVDKPFCCNTNTVWSWYINFIPHSSVRNL